MTQIELATAQSGFVLVSPTDGQIIVYNGSQWVNQKLPTVVATGPGATIGANSGTTLTIPSPGASSGFGQYHLTLAPASGSTVTATLPAPAQVGTRFVLRATQPSGGGISLAFAASPPVTFPGVALNLNTQAYAENWIAFECGLDNGGNPTWYGFPATSSIVNSLLEMCKVAATTNQTRSGTPTINGYATQVGDRVLLTGQTTGSQNGPWVVASGAWTRPADYPSAYTLTAAVVPISTSDTSFPGSLWFMNTSAPAIIDTTSTTWTQVPAATTPIGTATPLTDSITPSAGSTTTAAGDLHTHPRKFWTPSDHGLISWTIDPANVNAQMGSTPTNGTLYCAKLHLPIAQSITNVLLYVAAAGSGLTSGQCFAMLYQGGTLIGTSADQSATWNSTGLKTMALASGPFSVPSGDIVVAFFSNASTGGPKMAAGGTSGIVNAALSAANSRYFTDSVNTGRTTTPPGTLGTLAAFNNAIWAAVS